MDETGTLKVNRQNVELNTYADTVKKDYVLPLRRTVRHCRRDSRGCRHSYFQLIYSLRFPLEGHIIRMRRI